VILLLTGNGFAMCGLLHLKVLLKTALSKKVFRCLNYKKNGSGNFFLRLKMMKLSTQEPSIPHIAKPMLPAVPFFQ